MATSAQPSADPGSRQLQFLSPAELRDSVPAEPEWNWEGYIAPATNTLGAGKPKVGKTSLTLGVVDAIASEAPSFAGRQVRGGPVVVVSEEGPGTLAHKLPRSANVRILTRDGAWPKPPWPELVDATVQEAKRIGAVMLVVDTLPFWASMAPEREKDAGAAQAVMQELDAAARTGLAILSLGHSRKGGGEDGEALRGSNAFAAAADIIIELDRVKGHPRQRSLQALSRFPTTPGTLIVEHDPVTGQWSAVGEAEERGATRTLSDRQGILDALKDGEALTRGELEAVLDAPQLQWHDTLKHLERDGILTRSGRGVKGDPFRYSIPRTDSAQGDAHDSRRNGMAVVPISAAHPVRVQQNRNAVTEPAHRAECPSGDAPDDGRTTNTEADDELIDRLSAIAERNADIAAHDDDEVVITFPASDNDDEFAGAILDAFPGSSVIA